MTLQIGPADLARVMQCAGSVGLKAQLPRPERTDNADEGVAAHAAAQLVLNGTVGSIDELVDRQMSNGVFVTAEMADHLRGYIDRCRGALIEVPGEWSPAQGVTLKGVADAVRWNKERGFLQIVDLKYGWRIVEAVENWQLVAYAILNGGLSEECSEVHLTIYQPRPFHPEGPFRTWIVPRAKLQEYAHRITSRVTTLDDELQTGPACRYCRALSTCRAARDAQFNAIDAVTRASVPEPIDGVALASQLDVIEQAEQWLKLRGDAIRDAALDAIKTGTRVPGFGAKPKLGNSAWQDHVTPELVTAMSGVDVSTSSIMTPAAAKRAGVDESVINALTHRPARGMMLSRTKDGDAATAFATAKKG